ncbi:hypothetical protein SRHO_G00282460 [Serrasalmus rhombeus]
MSAYHATVKVPGSCTPHSCKCSPGITARWWPSSQCSCVASEGIAQLVLTAALQQCQVAAPGEAKAKVIADNCAAATKERGQNSSLVSSLMTTVLDAMHGTTGIGIVKLPHGCQGCYTDVAYPGLGELCSEEDSAPTSGYAKDLLQVHSPKRGLGVLAAEEETPHRTCAGRSG